MKTITKLIASILAAVGLISMSAAAFSDVPYSSNSYEAISDLNNLGIMSGYEDGTFKPSGYITRAEIAAITSRLEGETGKVKQTNTIFIDVSSLHWASGYIAKASSNGYINGDGYGHFYPDDYIKLQDVIKIFVCALGYSDTAKSMGGYPDGYIKAAESIDLVEGLYFDTYDYESYAKRGDVARVASKALDTPIGGNSGSTLRSSYFGGSVTTQTQESTFTKTSDGGYSLDFNGDGLAEGIYVEDSGSYQSAIMIYNKAKGDGEFGLCGDFIQMSKTSECYIVRDTNTGKYYIKTVGSLSDAKDMTRLYELTGTDFTCVDTWGIFVNKDEPGNYVTLYRTGFDAVDLGYDITGQYESTESEYEAYKNRYNFEQIHYFGDDI